MPSVKHLISCDAVTACSLTPRLRCSSYIIICIIRFFSDSCDGASLPISPPNIILLHSDSPPPVRTGPPPLMAYFSLWLNQRDVVWGLTTAHYHHGGSTATNLPADEVMQRRNRPTEAEMIFLITKLLSHCFPRCLRLPNLISIFVSHQTERKRAEAKEEDEEGDTCKQISSSGG